MAGAAGRSFLQLPALHLFPPNGKLYFGAKNVRIHSFHPKSCRLLCRLENGKSAACSEAHIVPIGKHPGMTDQLYNYILGHTREPQVLFFITPLCRMS
jgi:hypothetical protein